MVSVADNQNPLSESKPGIKNAKKKSADETSFDGALIATLAQNPKTVPGPDKELLQKLNEQVSAKVELSTKNAAKAESGGAPTPTIAALFKAQAEQSASGKMTGGLVAGPDQPWNSKWVFGADKMPSAEEMNAQAVPGEKLNLNLESLKKLVQDSAEGGDESKLKQTAGKAGVEVDASLQALLGELGAQIDSVKTEAAPTEPKSAMSGLGGAEFLAALQGAKVAAVGADGGGKQMAGGFGQSPENSSGASADELASALSGVAKAPAGVKGAAVTGVKPDLQVITGGRSPEVHLEGGMRLAKDEPNLGTTDSFMGATPLAAVVRGREGAVGVPPQVVTGHVVPGSMMRDRLTSETVRNMAASISNLAPQGGGEMKIRMNPANLGELMIHVSTNGKDVGLKVQASESGAKKIIEESLGALRDSLASQSLVLGQVDVTMAPTNTAQTDLGSNSQNQAPNHGAGFDLSSGQGDRSGNRSGDDSSSGSSWNGGRSNAASATSSRMAAMAAGNAARSRAAASESRLDVMA